MYPEGQILMEAGRITIAAGRLDAQLGALWWQLAPDQVDELDARRAPAGKVRGKIKTLADERLDAVHRDAIVAFVDEVLAAQTERNAVMHSRWLLRSQDAMRPVSEFFSLSDEERAAYLEEWETRMIRVRCQELGRQAGPGLPADDLANRSPGREWTAGVDRSRRRPRPWVRWTVVDSLNSTTDQKVGGSSPSERAN